MAKNKYEQKGEERRRNGESKPVRKTESWWTTKAEVRNRDDERIGWERENTRRSRKSKQK